jgi:arginase
MTGRRFTTVGIPIDSVGFGDGEARGTERSPAAVRAAGLDRLGWDDDGDLDVRITDDRRDPATGLVGVDGVLEATTRIRADVRARIERGERPFLLGGCCTLLPGALAGVRDAIGTIGLVYVDGHLDLYDGSTSPTGEAADMPIAVLLGRGPAAWNERAAPLPVLPAPAVALLGSRDPDERADLEATLAVVRADGVLALDAAAIAREGPADAARAALSHVGQASERLWFHVDLDVLGEDVFPATDYLIPGGLDWPALIELLRPLANAPGLVGWSVSCYNPDKDPDGACGHALVDAIEAVFEGPRRD